MYKYYTYAVECALKEKCKKVPSSRGRNGKIYHKQSLDILSKEELVVGLPYYEEIVEVRGYECVFPDEGIPLTNIISFYHSCRKCQLSLFRKNVVFYRANHYDQQADVVFIGQSPGKTEDEHGMPFIGTSGKLLDLMMKKSGFTRKHFLVNTVGCIPGDGPKTAKRDNPREPEILACLSRLWLLLRTMKPKYIVCLGSVPASLFTAVDKLLRYRWYSLNNNLKLAYIYHPAYISRVMQKGGMAEYTETIDFLAELQVREDVMRKEDGLWRMTYTSYEPPFHFLNKYEHLVT